MQMMNKEKSLENKYSADRKSKGGKFRSSQFGKMKRDSDGAS